MQIKDTMKKGVLNDWIVLKITWQVLLYCEACQWLKNYLLWASYPTSVRTWRDKEITF